MPGYKYKDVYLYANGKPQELDGAYAVDKGLVERVGSARKGYWKINET